MPVDEELALVGRRLTDTPQDPRLRWYKKARPEQRIPGGTWRVWYVRGGRGSGKTRTGAQALAEWVLGDTDGEGEYGIIAPTYADAWTKCVEGQSGVLRALGTSMAQIKDHRSLVVKSAWRTYGQVVLHNGIVIYVDSAAEGGLRIQGRNLKGAWCDEIGLWEKWEVAWNESLRYAVRMGISRIIATATPKASRPARRLIRSLLKNDPEHGGVVNTRLRTIDNVANLSKEFFRAVVGASQGTRLERQELEGELLDDVANALWTRDMIERAWCGYLGEDDGPEWLRDMVIGVDPSDGNETSDEQAYTIMGIGPPEDGHLYVVENWGGQEAPALFARRVILLAVQWDATLIVEKNHGGGWLKATFQQVIKDLLASGTIERAPRVRLIHASLAKRTRAEPVSALYERQGGLVRHCRKVIRKPCDCEDQAHPDGHEIPDISLAELEDQMCTFTGAAGERSPDRLDSLVWAATTYLEKSFGVPPPGAVVNGPRKWRAAQELEAVGQPENTRARRRLAQAHNGAYADGQWDLDEFAPRDDDSREDPEPGHRPNVRQWR